MAISPDMQSPATSAASAERSGSLADVLDVILDKGLVIDAFVRVSLVGIEILTVDARIVVASVDTYMHFAREAHRLQMGGDQGSGKQGLAGMMGRLAEGGAHDIGRGALRGAGEGLREGLLPHRQESGDRRGVVQRAVGAIRDAVSGNNDQERQGGSAGEEGGSRDDSSAPGPARRAAGAVRDALGSEQSEHEEGHGGASGEEERAPAQRSPQSTARSTRRQGQGHPQGEQASGQSRRRQSRAEDPRDSAEADRGTGGPEPPRGRSGESPPQGRQRVPRRTAPSSRRAPSREPRD